MTVGSEESAALGRGRGLGVKLFSPEPFAVKCTRVIADRLLAEPGPAPMSCRRSGPHRAGDDLAAPSHLRDCHARRDWSSEAARLDPEWKLPSRRSDRMFGAPGTGRPAWSVGNRCRATDGVELSSTGRAGRPVDQYRRTIYAVPRELERANGASW